MYIHVIEYVPVVNLHLLWLQNFEIILFIQAVPQIGIYRPSLSCYSLPYTSVFFLIAISNALDIKLLLLLLLLLIL